MSDFKCESPIEFIMADRLAPVVAPTLKLIAQHPIKAQAENYRADFFIEASGRRVVIECDGKDYHDYSDDLIRDLMMLGYGNVTDVIRFRGCDVNFLPRDCIKFLRGVCPFLFDVAAAVPDFTRLWGGCQGMRDLDIKPVYRGLVSAAEFAECEPIIRAAGVCKSRGLTGDGQIVVELKHALWDRKFTPPKTWRLDDYLRWKATIGDTDALIPWMGLLGVRMENAPEFPD